MGKSLQEQAADLIRQGWQQRAVAEYLGCSKGTVQNAVYSAGLMRRTNRKDVGEMIRLHQEGWTQRKIAEKLGTSREVVRRHLLQHGYKRGAIEQKQLPKSIRAHRCPTCGGKVEMPCRMCRDRKVVERSQLLKRMKLA